MLTNFSPVHIEIIREMILNQFQATVREMNPILLSSYSRKKYSKEIEHILQQTAGSHIPLSVIENECTTLTDQYNHYIQHRLKRLCCLSASNEGKSMNESSDNSSNEDKSMNESSANSSIEGKSKNESSDNSRLDYLDPRDMPDVYITHVQDPPTDDTDGSESVSQKAWLTSKPPPAPDCQIHPRSVGFEGPVNYYHKNNLCVQKQTKYLLEQNEFLAEQNQNLKEQFSNLLDVYWMTHKRVQELTGKVQRLTQQLDTKVTSVDETHSKKKIRYVSTCDKYETKRNVSD